MTFTKKIFSAIATRTHPENTMILSLNQTKGRESLFRTQESDEREECEEVEMEDVQGTIMGKWRMDLTLLLIRRQ